MLSPVEYPTLVSDLKLVMNFCDANLGSVDIVITRPAKKGYQEVLSNDIPYLCLVFNYSTKFFFTIQKKMNEHVV